MHCGFLHCDKPQYCFLDSSSYALTPDAPYLVLQKKMGDKYGQCKVHRGKLPPTRAQYELLDFFHTAISKIVKLKVEGMPEELADSDPDKGLGKSAANMKGWLKDKKEVL